MKNLSARMPQMFSLRVILSVAFVSQILITAGLVGYLSFRNEQNSVNLLALQLRGEIATRIEQHLQTFLGAPRRINRFNASLISNGSLNAGNVKELQAHFLEQVKTSPTISSIYFGNAEGGIVGSGREGALENSLYIYSTENFQPGVFEKYTVDESGKVLQLSSSIPDFDSRIRPWYTNAVQSKSPVWSDVYILFTGQDMAIAASAPVFNENGGLIGVSSVDIFLSQISDFLSRQHIGQNGAIFIVEPSGLMVATSSNDPLFFDQDGDGRMERVNVRETNTPIIQSTARFLFQKFGGYQNIPNKQDFMFSNDDERIFAKALSLEDEYGLHWLIIVAMPESDFAAGVIENNRITFLIIFTALLISIFLSIYIAEKISNPISQFIEATQALSKQEWSGAVASRTRIRELNDLALSFNQTSEKLRESLNNLSSEVLVRERTQRSLLESESRYSTLITNIPIGVFRSKKDGSLMTANPAFLKMFGLSEDTPIDFINVANLYRSIRSRENFLKILLREGSVSGSEIPFIRKDKSTFWGSVTAKAIYDNEDNLLHIDGTIEDITEKKKADDTLKFMATHDALTKIPNRALFEDRLSHALERTRRKNQMLAVVFVDLDNFKSVNDAFGHKHGDWLLQLIVERLKDCIRASDTVARFGGDEFAVILEELNTADDAAPILDKISIAVSKPFIVQDAEIFITSSMGVSIFPFDGESPDSLIQNADRSMYYAKETGKNNYQFYSLEMKTQTLERLELGNQLRHAIEQQELSIYYQPQVSIETGRVIGLEALLRWKHPTHGLLLPGKFIPLAQDLGLIVPLGQWALETVCAQINRWTASGLPIRVAVNISERESRRKDFVQVIENILSEYQTPPDLLELELTETVIFKDVENMEPLLRRIKHLGVRLAIDDFGTGHSSLARLAQFPFDTLKLDKFFAPRHNSPNSELIVAEGIFSIAKKLGLDVIAEGVETKPQIAFYESLNCKYVQGWYFSAALPADEVETYLREGFKLDS